MYTVEVLSQPVKEPLSLTGTKLHLKVESSVTADDALISSLITAAREYVEDVLGRAVVMQKKRLTLDGFPSAAAILDISSPPLQSISAIKYIDTAGAEQTISSAEYKVDTRNEPARVVPEYGYTWPSTRQEINSVWLEYFCGYTTYFTANQATDKLTFSGRNPVDDEVFRLVNRDGALPAGLSANTDYYVINTSGATCELSLTSGGSKIDITDAGTGEHFAGLIPAEFLQAMLLIIGHWYEHREEVSELKLLKVPFVADSLLWPRRVFYKGA